VDACGGGGGGPIEIRACCDDGDAAQIAREVAERGAIRKMFRGVLQA